VEKAVCEVVKTSLQQLFAIGISFTILPPLRNCEAASDTKTAEDAEANLSNVRTEREVGDDINMTLSVAS